MVAVVGVAGSPVLERLETLGLTPATSNGGGQVVAAGGLSALAGLAAEAPLPESAAVSRRNTGASGFCCTTAGA